MKAIILAAGKGSRLFPLTKDIPKILIPIHKEKKVIHYLLESFPPEINELFFVVSHQKEKIIQFFTEQENERYFSRFKSIHFVFQKEITGTMGAVNLIQSFIKKGEKFFVIHGDDLHKKEDVYHFVQKIDYGMSFMKIRYNPNYYAFDFKDGCVSSSRKQNEREKKEGAYIASGMFILDDRVFSFPQKILFSQEIGLPQTILRQKEKVPIQAFIENAWFPINTFDDLEKARSFYQKKDR